MRVLIISLFTLFSTVSWGQFIGQNGVDYVSLKQIYTIDNNAKVAIPPGFVANIGKCQDFSLFNFVFGLEEIDICDLEQRTIEYEGILEKLVYQNELANTNITAFESQLNSFTSNLNNVNTVYLILIF